MQCTWSKFFTVAKEYLFLTVRFTRFCLSWDTKHEESKQKRRKPWIRYERAHSLSLVHTDWHHCENGKYLCAVLDDASRKILAAGEFDNETTENAIAILKKAYDECKP